MSSLDDVATSGRFRYCFPAGTPVSTPSGRKNIEEIKEGDEVYAWDFENNRQVVREVITTFTRFTQELVQVRLDDGSSLETTGAHPFWVVSEGWKIADDLQEGIQLFGIDGRKQRIVSISRRQELSAVYNFEVDELHNYFAGLTPILVHNQDAIHPNFNNAVNEALEWLRSQGIDTSKPTGLVKSRLRPDPHFGKPIGVIFEGGGSYRIEFHNVDGVPRAHINVQAGKVKGPHVLFEGNQRTVNSVRRQLFNC